MERRHFPIIMLVLWLISLQGLVHTIHDHGGAVTGGCRYRPAAGPPQHTEPAPFLTFFIHPHRCAACDYLNATQADEPAPPVLLSGSLRRLTGMSQPRRESPFSVTVRSPAVPRAPPHHALYPSG
ncbi:MAG: hypothetical protein JW781_03470 [Deltaproteobacteria bacterium]|nr:hypothetical protein [Candidatus Anaeroferrophillacea bacterium]